jgi:anti-sigma regulatory factor (Ser/Thr protein kinase)
VNARLLLIALERESDIVLVRKRTRRLAELLGFDRQDQTRITTAVSELARNAFEYAGAGRAEFRVRDAAPAHGLEIIISDKGPGIADLMPCCPAVSPPRREWVSACAARGG